MADQFQFRRDTATNWTSNDPVLEAGEPGLETDTGKMKIGDGSTAWSALSYQNMDAVDHQWINNTELQFSNPDGSWGTAVDLAENASNVSTVDNGDGTINITFTFDRGGTHTITIPALGNNADTVDGYDADLVAATVPQHYSRSHRWRAKSNTARTTITTPDKILVNIEGSGYKYTGPTDIDLDTTTLWDDTTYQTPANRAGGDFYIYACVPSSGQVFDIVLSANSTIPTGYTASTSRKIGGFHCLCVDVGTNVQDPAGIINLDQLDEAYVSHSITGNSHWMTGYIAGDILPFSIWDLEHKPSTRYPEGMTYDGWKGRWIDIYLPHWDGSKFVSQYGAQIADGVTSISFHAINWDELLSQVGKRLPYEMEHRSYAIGSPQGVNISGSADPGTTGGHVATNGARIISLFGVEDATGVMWQWGSDQGATNDVGSAWANADTSGTAGSYDAVYGIHRGQHYEAPNRPRFSGGWGNGAKCGSRGSIWSFPALGLLSSIGGRGVAEPLGRRS